MVTGILLVGLAVAFRLLSPVYHMWNLVPAGAVALYAGARLPRRWAWTVPIAAMFLSDLFLGYGDQWPLFGLTRWTIYGTLAATTLLGRLARSPRVHPWMVPGLAIGGSLLFFLTTNFATWAEGELYPMTGSGLALCYAMGLEFLRPTLAADLIGTCALFGVGPVIERATRRRFGARSATVAEVKSAEFGQVV